MKEGQVTRGSLSSGVVMLLVMCAGRELTTAVQSVRQLTTAARPINGRIGRLTRNGAA